MRSPPLLDLAIGDFSQVVDRSRSTRDDTGSHLSGTTKEVFREEGISGRVHLNTNDSDTRVVLRTVVRSIAEISEPGLQGRSIVLLDEGSIGHKTGLASHRSPFSRGVDE